MHTDIHHLFVKELEDVLSAERQIIEALPEAITAVESSELKEALKHHLQETKEQAKRLVKIFEMINVKAKEDLCLAMQGLIKECKQAIKEFEKSAVRDAAIIAKLQRIEHYEISAYGTLRTLVKEIKFEEMNDVVKLLEETLKEESNADKKLTKLAEGGLLSHGINKLASKENV